MSTLLFATPHALFAGCTVGLGLIVGLALTRGLVFRCTAERLAVGTGMGLGALGCALSALAAAGWLHREAVLALVAAAVAAASAWMLRRPRVGPRALPGPGLLRVALASGAGAVGAVLLAPVFLLALYPPVLWDAIGYHLPSARAFVEHHGLVITPFLRYPAFTQLGDLLFTPAFLFGTDLDAQLVQLVFSGVVACTVFAWGERASGWRAGAWAASLWLGCTLVVEYSTVAYVDMTLTAFCTLALFAFHAAGEPGGAGKEASHGGWLVAAGAFAGMAAATKQTGLFFCLGPGLVLAVRALRTRRWDDVARFVLPAVALAAPWYARIMAATGNPLFPFGAAIFGPGPWNEADYRLVAASVRGAGLPGGPWDIPSALWHVGFRHGAMGFRAFPSDWQGPVGAAVMAGGVAWAWARVPAARAWLATAAAYLGVWLVTGPQVRYLLPVLPLVCLVKGTLADGVPAAIPGLRRRAVPLAWAVVGCALLLHDGGTHATRVMEARGPLPTDATARAALLTAVIPTHSYPAYAWMNARRGRDYTVYALHDDTMAHYCDGRFRGDVIGPTRYSGVLGAMGDGRSLHRAVRGFGADYFLVTEYYGHTELPRDAWFTDHFRPVYRDRNVRLFEVLAAPPD
ncbi:MAG: glycosyltransferase family 39 protein [Candidatus Eisenbacteria bacterium]|nr:glycosyltransferase family 39 protein [Candidatus Eisenbacteria bacterium]